MDGVRCTEDEIGRRERRARCSRCRRPLSVCYCAHLTEIPSRTRVVLLQHPREEDCPIGTAHMATLCLPNASLHVGVDFDDAPFLDELTSDPSRPAMLLYPGEGARDIVADPPDGPITLVVVDGTWAQAKKLVKTNRRLANLPRVAFDPPAPSAYRIRREPDARYLSTLESLVLVLGALEADPAKFAPLLEPFHAMIAKQLACEREYQGARARRRRRAPRERQPLVPSALVDAARTRLVVSGEVNAWPYGSPQRSEDGYRDEVVVWVAERLETGERFAAVVAPTYPLAVGTPLHAEIPRDRFSTFTSRAELRSAWAAFLRDTDVLCTWGHHAAGLFLAEGHVLPEVRVDVRAAARRLAGGKVGTLEAHGEAIGVDASRALPQYGRAARRLALLCGIVRHICSERSPRAAEGDPRA